MFSSTSFLMNHVRSLRALSVSATKREDDSEALAFKESAETSLNQCAVCRNWHIQPSPLPQDFGGRERFTNTLAKKQKESVSRPVLTWHDFEYNYVDCVPLLSNAF